MTDPTKLPSRLFVFDLPTQSSEVIKMKISDELLQDQQWKDIDTTGHLPLCFVVSPLGSCGLIS